MISLSDYLNGAVSHDEYYSQYCTTRMQSIVVQSLGKSRIVAALADDRHLNSIPLSEWDRLGRAINSAELSKAFKEAGDFVTLAGLVCVAKQCAGMAVVSSDA